MARQTSVKKVPHAEPEKIDDYNYDQLLAERHGNKSNVIRFLSAKGFKRSEISKFTGLRYQHVRNVLVMPVTKPRE